MKWITGHFHRYRERTPWNFCWRIAIEGTLVSVAVACSLALLGIPDREHEGSIESLVVPGIIVAPILETFLLQALPVGFARLFKARFSTQVIFSVIPFAGLHAVQGVVAGIAAGLVGGFYFAFTYVHWRERSRWKAFWVTAVSHLMHNALVILPALALGGI